MGAITEAVRRHIPATYRAMIGPSEQTDYYSLADLQALADYVQQRLFATVAGITNEATVFDIRHVEFLGKVTTLRFIPAAIDYWMDQSETVQTHGPEETINFPARIAHLREVFQRLSADVADEWNDVLGVAGAHNSVPDVSYGDNGRGVLITPDPAEFRPILRRHGVYRNGIIPSLDHLWDDGGGC
jgi:hypothetical protein